ncbi:hypothetical protein SAMN02799624_06163 [Paenibacillus sp. UNC496MF]|nr:hypothetical protein SAMN02799624_06163 [Paenibacillus sp. UNC496MF]
MSVFDYPVDVLQKSWISRASKDKLYATIVQELMEDAVSEIDDSRPLPGTPYEQIKWQVLSRKQIHKRANTLGMFAR